MAETAKTTKTTKTANSTFDELNAVDVSAHKEDKPTANGKTLSYLSWAWAWAEVKKRCPDANYEIIKFDGIPYVYDEKTGYMVYTKVTIEGLTHEMWLPVMDSNNLAMKAVEYQVQTKFKTITVKAATMFDINKTIMRCLTKNLAMFGLGLYIYAGEDLPEEITEQTEDAPKTAKKPQKKAPANVCSVCGKEITAYGQYTAEVVLQESTKKLGKPTCMPCWQKQYAEAKKKEADANAK